MFKVISFILAVGIATFTYLQKKNFDLQTFSFPPPPTPIPTPGPTPTPLLIKTPIPLKYAQGICFKNSADDFGFVRILKADVEKNVYIYQVCDRYKGCQKETAEALSSQFESLYPENLKITCP